MTRLPPRVDHDHATGEPRGLSRDQQQLVERRMREQGYADGYARRTARFTLRDYQVAYRRGSIARDAVDEAGESDLCACGHWSRHHTIGKHNGCGHCDCKTFAPTVPDAA